MRRIVTGTDVQGRSTVLSDGAAPVAFHAGSSLAATKIDGASAPWPVPASEAVVFELWNLGTQPALASEDPTLPLDAPDYETPTAETKWIITHMGPNLDVPMHATPTVDYGLVVSGEVELGLQTGPVLVRAGDAMLVNGVQHSWKAGPQGCVIATVLVGLRAEDR
jgi:mannose-6-phosphate isomerase-like protein (cupin superfamily)